MKRIVLHKDFSPLGKGLQTIQPLSSTKKWIYLVPSGSLIPKVKEMLLDIKQPHVQKGIEVMTFDQMMRQIALNSEHSKMLTPSEQELLVKHAVEQVHREKGIIHFYESMNKTGWLHQVEMWIGEIKRAGVTSDQLIALWQEDSQKNKELAWIYEAYHQLLQKYALIDHEESYYLFLRQTELGESLHEYMGVVTDQFYDFSPIQMQVLDKLGGLGLDIIVHLAVDEQRPELFQWTLNTIDFLTNLGFQQERNTEENQEMQSKVSPAINHLKKAIFFPFPEKIDAHQSVHLLAVPGNKREVEMVAAEIKSYALGQAIPLHEMAIIVPQMERYKVVIYEVMEKAGIPIRLAKRQRLIENPFVQAIISLLKAMNGQKNDWLSMLVSPYFKWNQEIDPYQLTHIFRSCGYPMTQKSWNERFISYKQRYESKENELKKYDDVMQTIFKLAEIAPKKGMNQEYIQFINRLEQTLQIKEQIKQYFFSNPTEETAFRDLKAYEKWQEVKQELAMMDQYMEGEHGENQVDFWNWIQSLILACEKSDYDFTQGKKQGISILQPNQIRGQQFKIVFILGLVEGDFPRPIKNDWLMPDQERYELRKQGIHLNLSREYENQQKYHFYQSIASATEQLYLVYSSKNEEGKEWLRSFFIEECLECIIEETYDTKTLDVSDLVPRDFQDCAHEEQLWNKVFKENHDLIKDMLREQDEEKIRKIENGISSEKERDLLFSSYDGNLQQAQHVEEMKQWMTKKVWSTSQLNQASQCRFAYFAKDILKLTEWEEPEESMSPNEKGDLIHRVLQRFFSRFRKNGGEIFHPELQGEYEKWLLQIAEEEWQVFLHQNERTIHPVLSDLDWQKVVQDLKQIVRHEQSWRKKSGSTLYPQYLEFSFGMPIDEEMLRKEEIDPLSTTEKAEIQLPTKTLVLRGKIDRIDVNEEGQFVIYDYKTGQPPENKEIKQGIHLQLPLYLFVLESLFHFPLDLAIGASFYTQGKRNDKGEIVDSRNRGIWKNDFLDQVGISNRVGSKIDEEEWQQWVEEMKIRIEQLLTEMEQGDFSVLPSTECPSYCPFQHICRKDEERIKNKIRLKEGV
ncbi:MAG: PD-(D/E)XK nuclease family protein [Tepidibacillus sp.]